MRTTPEIWTSDTDGVVTDSEGQLVAVIGHPEDAAGERHHLLAARIATLPDLELVTWALLHTENTARDEVIEFDVGQLVSVPAKDCMPDFAHLDWPAAREALARFRAEYAEPSVELSAAVANTVQPLDGYAQDLRCA